MENKDYPYVLTLDFETKGIEKGSACTPEPIGVAWKINDEPSEYRQFTVFHSDKLHMQNLVFGASKIIGHNLKFDLRVLDEHFSIKITNHEMIEDTMLLHFLYDPNVKERGLKKASVQYLGRSPDEQDELKEWLTSKESPLKCVTNKKHDNYYMKHLELAPLELVAKYARADVEMTYELYNKFYLFVKENMSSAYDREKQFMLNLIEMEQVGIRLDVKALRLAYTTCQLNIKKLESWIKNRLGNYDLNLKSPQQLAEALQEANLLDLSRVTRTKTGKISTTKDSIEKALLDPLFTAVYCRYKEEEQCLNTFLIPWMLHIRTTDGGEEECILYTDWKSVGAITGRVTSSPNFQNFPKQYEKRFQHEYRNEREGKVVSLHPDAPECPIEGIGSMPVLRSLIIPRYEGHRLISIDYSQQELRILAHFEDGELLKMYQDDPYTDVHSKTQQLLSDILGIEVKRPQVKTLAFGIIYCMGVNKLANSLNLTYEEAKHLRDAYMDIFPGLRRLQDQMRYLANNDEPLETIGGRLCKCQPLQEREDGTLQDLSYKMVNTACQGSGADAMKKAINNFQEAKYNNRRGHFLLLLNVHDEILISVREQYVEEAFYMLKEAMESVPCDAKLVAEGNSEGALRWSDLK